MLGRLLDSNKRLWYVLGGLVAIAIMLGAGMLLTAALGDREVSAAENEAASGEHAAALFSCKVEDVHNTAAVVALLETMDMESINGKYAVQIAAGDEGQKLTLTTEEAVREADVKKFNKSMEQRAQQMLALIPQLDTVEWIYSVKNENGTEQAVGSIDEAAAAKALGDDAESFGKSEQSFRKLLALQAK